MLSTFLRSILCYFWTVKASGLYFDLVQYLTLWLISQWALTTGPACKKFVCWWGKSMSSGNISKMQEVCQLMGESTGSNKSSWLQYVGWSMSSCRSSRSQEVCWLIMNSTSSAKSSQISQIALVSNWGHRNRRDLQNFISKALKHCMGHIIPGNKNHTFCDKR